MVSKFVKLLIWWAHHKSGKKPWTIIRFWVFHGYFMDRLLIKKIFVEAAMVLMLFFFLHFISGWKWTSITKNILPCFVLFCLVFRHKPPHKWVASMYDKVESPKDWITRRRLFLRLPFIIRRFAWHNCQFAHIMLRYSNSIEFGALDFHVFW